MAAPDWLSYPLRVMARSAEDRSIRSSPAAPGLWLLVGPCLAGLCLTSVSLICRPSVAADPDFGMLEWRTLMRGGPTDSIVQPDPENVAKDRAWAIAWWSPGQYLIPGALSRLNLSVGASMAVCAGLGFVLFAWGWTLVLRRCGLRQSAATWILVFLCATPHALSPFLTYNGGDQLLQAAVPWIVLGSLGVPESSMWIAAVMSCAGVLAAFFLKLSGSLVVGTMIGAVCIVDAASHRRIKPGVAGAAAGVLVAAGLVWAGWLRRGPTPGSAALASFHHWKAFAAVVFPWESGLGLTGSLSSGLSEPEFTARQRLLALLGALLVIAATLGSLRSRSTVIEETGAPSRHLTRVAVCWCLLYAGVIWVLYARGARISPAERHFRAQGTLVLVCALAAVAEGRRRVVGAPLVLLCAGLSIVSVARYTTQSIRAMQEEIDPVSGTRTGFSAAALTFARQAYEQGGTEALFIVSEPRATLALPTEARVWSNVSAATTGRYLISPLRGKVRGAVYMLMLESQEQQGLAAQFERLLTDYSADGWGRRQFGGTVVFVHPPE
jgi:hypothetical protein